MKRLRAIEVSAPALVMGLVIPVAVSAQQVGSTETGETPAPDARAAQTTTRDAASGDIIVTARRRDESLSKVPIAISVLSSDALAQQNIRSEVDLQAAVPGLTVRESGGNNILNFAVRGQSIDVYTNSPPAVLPYINEFQVVSYTASAFFDLENVQVLKGPQGTLFGRNTTGGAVLYQTASPGREAKGFFTVRVGNLDEHQVTIGATMPIADWASLRLAGNFSDGGAFITNLYDGSKRGNNLNKTGRATLRLTPGGGFRNTTTFQYGEDRGTNTPNLPYTVNACGATYQGRPLASDASCLYNPANPAFAAILKANPRLFSGGLEAYPAYQRDLGNRLANTNVSNRHRAETRFVINTTEVDLSSSLTLKNIVGWNKSSRNDVNDYDGTSYAIYENAEADIGQVNTTRQFSDELQLQGKLLDGKLTFVLGGFYSNQTDGLISNGLFFGTVPVVYSFELNTKSLAGFAQATYNLTDTLHLTSGFRYSEDRVKGRNRPGSAFGQSSQSLSNTKPSWTVSLDYQVTPELLLYATHRGSWRSGGYNFTAFPLNQTAATGGNVFLPETSKDVELGAKFNGRLGTMPFTMTLAGYNQWVDNVQRAIFQVIQNAPALVTVNVPKAEITGGELAITARPAPWLDIGAAGTYTDARFTDPTAIAFGIPITYGPYGDVSRWSGSAYAQVRHALPQGAVALRGDVYAQTSFYFSNLADSYAPGTRIPGYALANARLSWEDALGSGTTISAYVRNIFDRQYFTGGLPASTGFGVNSVNAGRPRIYGAEVRFLF
ncbi:TonB-dependent receptor [Sphingomonadaceae bacterium jetA1]|jgi:iron complex outermembrane receptor protein|uniref:TonB-dependent receptor n=1 Tax=Facivitalis istanbulensis TaxID=3075838 RepID=UPI003473F5E8